MAEVAGGSLEIAITLLNTADVIHRRDGMAAGEARIYALLEQAAAHMHREDIPRDGYYAFVCEKCAPTFDYYGWFAEARDLTEEAERIYAGA